MFLCGDLWAVLPSIKSSSSANIPQDSQAHMNRDGVCWVFQGWLSTVLGSQSLNQTIPSKILVEKPLYILQLPDRGKNIKSLSRISDQEPWVWSEVRKNKLSMFVREMSHLWWPHKTWGATLGHQSSTTSSCLHCQGGFCLLGKHKGSLFGGVHCKVTWVRLEEFFPAAAAAGIACTESKSQLKGSGFRKDRNISQIFPSRKYYGTLLILLFIFHSTSLKMLVAV